MEITTAPFGVTDNGEAARTFTLSNGRMSVVLTDLGATILAVNLPDGGGTGSTTNVAPCHQTLEKLQPNDLGANPKMGTTCGRVCNRTAKARFVLDGATFPLAKNDGEGHIHGGVEKCFDRRVWTVTGTKVTPDAASVSLELLSPDGEEGYPGAVLAGCIISLTRDDCMGIQYTGEMQDGKSTVFSLTNHCYW
jgi:aldose 1-epimerase